MSKYTGADHYFIQEDGQTMSMQKLLECLNQYETERQALINIVLNAKVISDPSKDGQTDIYGVPLDDIENARKLLPFDLSHCYCPSA